MKRLRKVAVGLMGLSPEPGAMMAGVARTAFRLLESMAETHPETRFVAYVTREFNPPPEFRLRDNIEFRTIRRYRIFDRIGGLLARLSGCQVWFSPAYDGFDFPMIPQVSLIHDVFPFTHPEWFEGTPVAEAQGRIERQIRKSKGLIANSQATKDETERAFPGSAARCTVVPLALGNVVVPSGAPYEALPFARYVLTLGTIEPRKNLPALLRAWAKIDRPGVGLVVAGGKGWGLESLQNEARALRIEDRVHFTGYVPDADLPSLMGGCEVFVSPSLDEGFGITVLEAMAYGAPVLSSDAGALREVGGEAVRYFPPTDEGAMAEAIERALDHPEERAAWIERGFVQARRFSWAESARATYDVLARCA